MQDPKYMPVNGLNSALWVSCFRHKASGKVASSRFICFPPSPPQVGSCLFPELQQFLLVSKLNHFIGFSPCQVQKGISAHICIIQVQAWQVSQPNAESKEITLMIHPKHRAGMSLPCYEAILVHRPK